MYIFKKAGRYECRCVCGMYICRFVGGYVGMYVGRYVDRCVGMYAGICG